MDTDGYVDTLGRCGITTIGYPLAKQYTELIASLGHRPTIATKTAMLYGKACSLRHEVTFTPTAPVFRLHRKRLRQEFVRRQFVNRGRAVVDVAPFRACRCAASRSARRERRLVTRSYIPTHNSSLGRLGLIVHATAGSSTRASRAPLRWRSTTHQGPDQPVARPADRELSFMTLDPPAVRPYGHQELGSTTRARSRRPRVATRDRAAR